MLIQGQLLEAVRGDNPEMVAAHKQAAAAIQTELAGLYATQHKLDQVTSLCYPLCVCLCLCLSVATHLPKHVWLGVGSRPPPPPFHLRSWRKTFMSCTYLACCGLDSMTMMCNDCLVLCSTIFADLFVGFLFIKLPHSLLLWSTGSGGLSGSSKRRCRPPCSCSGSGQAAFGQRGRRSGQGCMHTAAGGTA